MAGITSTTFLFALAGGILPALLWLWFWLKEDIHPEPRNALIITFLSGAGIVIVALAFEYIVSLFFGGFLMVLLWAFTEEILKYFAAWKTAFTKTFFNEPIDALVYMITAALGFSALENIFFMLKAFSLGGLLSGFIAGDLRFLGATLLHTTCSAIVGASIAFSFFHKERRKYNIIGGIMLASVLHFTFNYFIIKSDGENMLKIFIPLWLGIIAIIFIFEKVKRIKSNA